MSSRIEGADGMKAQTEILIVEDSPTQAKLLERLLTENGYVVHVARNGAEGLQAAVRKKPAVVISDVMMPEMDGYEMCRRIKNTEEIKGTPVVLLTSLSDPRNVIKGLECGADNFLTKPYDGEHLIQRLEHILTNLELRKTGQAQMMGDVFFAGQYHRLTADRIQIIDLLLSTFEAAMLQSAQLEKLGGDYRNALEDAKRTRENFQTLMETTGDAVIVVGDNGTIYYANPAAENLFDTKASDLVGRPFAFPLNVNGGEHREVTITRSDGTKVVGDMRVATSNWDGKLVQFATIRDVSEMARLRELLKTEAITDALTGLHNRRGFMLLGEELLRKALEKESNVLCFFGDLDGFKSVNDTLGHEEGDKVLQEAAEALRKTFRSSDILARVGGDEFAVLALRDTARKETDIVGRLRQALDAINARSLRPYRIVMSVGVSLWEPENPLSLGELMTEADKKMYREKEERKKVSK